MNFSLKLFSADFSTFFNFFLKFLKFFGKTDFFGNFVEKKSQFYRKLIYWLYLKMLLRFLEKNERTFIRFKLFGVCNIVIQVELGSV